MTQLRPIFIIVILLTSCQSKKSAFFKQEVKNLTKEAKVKRVRLRSNQNKKIDRNYSFDGSAKFRFKTKDNTTFLVYWTEYEYFLEKVKKDSTFKLGCYSDYPGETLRRNDSVCTRRNW